MNFIIPGSPVPKERPRKGASGAFYTPQKTKAYESKVAAIALLARQENRQKPFQGPVALRLVICKDEVRVQVSPHINGKKSFRGDVTNIVKAIEDGMNGVTYEDDRQITYLEVVCK